MIRPATKAQVSYAQHLLKQLGVKSPTPEEVEALDSSEISDLIDHLKKTRGEAEWYGGGKFKGWKKATASALRAAAEVLVAAERQPVPDFESYQDALDWIAQRSKAYGGKMRFTSSEEYREAEPIVRKLYNQSKKKQNPGLSEAELAKHGLKIGDRVARTVVGPFLNQERFTGKLARSKKGPVVKLDHEMPVNRRGRMSYVKSIAWDPSWKKA